MIRRGFKYLIIAFVNLIILTGILALWTDRLELLFNDNVRPIEFTKIILFTILSLIGMRILIWYFRKRKIYSNSIKIKTSIILTILISSFLYINYSYKLINNLFLKRQLRHQIELKVKLTNELGNGTKGDNLTYQEYEEITKMNWFPKIPVESSNIDYIYEYSGFLPDYNFEESYDIPKKLHVDTFTFQKGDFKKGQKIILIGKNKRIKYFEYEL